MSIHIEKHQGALIWVTGNIKLSPDLIITFFIVKLLGKVRLRIGNELLRLVLQDLIHIDQVWVNIIQ